MQVREFQDDSIQAGLTGRNTDSSQLSKNSQPRARDAKPASPQRKNRVVPELKQHSRSNAMSSNRAGVSSNESLAGRVAQAQSHPNQAERIISMFNLRSVNPQGAGYEQYGDFGFRNPLLLQAHEGVMKNAAMCAALGLTGMHCGSTPSQEAPARVVPASVQKMQFGAFSKLTPEQQDSIYQAYGNKISRLLTSKKREGVSEGIWNTKNPDYDKKAAKAFSRDKQTGEFSAKSQHLQYQIDRYKPQVKDDVDLNQLTVINPKLNKKIMKQYGQGLHQDAPIFAVKHQGKNYVLAGAHKIADLKRKGIRRHSVLMHDTELDASPNQSEVK